MKVDVKQSIYHEAPSAVKEFDRKELRRCRYILRRLRFIEARLEQTGGMTRSSAGGAAHAEWEIEALEWLLTEVGYLDEKREKKDVRH